MSADNIAACELLAADGRVLLRAVVGEFSAPPATAWAADVARVRWLDAAGAVIADVPARLRPAPVAAGG